MGSHKPLANLFVLQEILCMLSFRIASSFTHFPVASSSHIPSNFLAVPFIPLSSFNSILFVIECHPINADDRYANHKQRLNTPKDMSVTPNYGKDIKSEGEKIAQAASVVNCSHTVRTSSQFHRIIPLYSLPCRPTLVLPRTSSTFSPNTTHHLVRDRRPSHNHLPTTSSSFIHSSS